MWRNRSKYRKWRNESVKLAAKAIIEISMAAYRKWHQCKQWRKQSAKQTQRNGGENGGVAK
jgi:hypothetical protein